MMKRKLQVFVSSTFLDLKDERQAAVEAILKAGHIPAGMELFTAGDKSQMETIERWIDESDVHMLILGGRYGSTEKTSELSYTELEYNYAIESKKPTFAVVITPEALEEKIRSRGSDFMEKNNPKALASFREKVLSNVSSFFSDSKDVKLCVHESLSDFARNSDLKGWISADEIEDTQSIKEELRQLRTENEALTQSLREAESKITGKPASNEPDSDLVEILRATHLTIPPNISGLKEEISRDLLSITFDNKEHLINGITNQYGMDDIARFFYFQVFPRLKLHGLADDERVAGKSYRRSFVTKKGLAFLGSLERQARLKKAKDAVKASDGDGKMALDKKPVPKKNNTAQEK